MRLDALTLWPLDKDSSMSKSIQHSNVLRCLCAVQTNINSLNIVLGNNSSTTQEEEDRLTMERQRRINVHLVSYCL